MDSILENALGPDRAQQAAAQRRDLLERLMARLAHEIRNPLSSLGVHVQLLEEDVSSLAGSDDSRIASRFEIIRGELHRLESIVGHFLRLAGPSALDLEDVDLAKVVHHVCDLLRPEAESRGIQILVELPEQGLPLIVADQVRITQALLNVVINAMQAVTKSGTVRVDVGADSKNASIRVLDNGPGIPIERLEAIFDPYFTTKEEGSGLGLWIAEQIVTAHRGVLQARNAPERGAVFTITLPRERKEAPNE